MLGRGWGLCLDPGGSWVSPCPESRPAWGTSAGLGGWTETRTKPALVRVPSLLQMGPDALGSRLCSRPLPSLLLAAPLLWATHLCPSDVLSRICMLCVASRLGMEGRGSERG